MLLKKKNSYLNLKRGKECTGTSSDGGSDIHEQYLCNPLKSQLFCVLKT